MYLTLYVYVLLSIFIMDRITLSYANDKDLYQESEVSSAESINTLKQIYHSCMDVQSLNAKKSDEILKKVSEFGYWPIIHGNFGGEREWDANSFDLTQLLISIKLSRDIGVFFDVSVSPDEKNLYNLAITDLRQLAPRVHSRECDPGQNYHSNSRLAEFKMANRNQQMISVCRGSAAYPV
ncbi:peptidase family m13 domain-containing protein [Ditylenchus destructor]|nr:peptidase family m13 domain-containing protein [Ditylenchus destructor]